MRIPDSRRVTLAPTGRHHSSPGLRAALPWGTAQNIFPNPNAGCIVCSSTRRNPLRGRRIFCAIPQGSSWDSQPWAGVLESRWDSPAPPRVGRAALLRRRGVRKHSPAVEAGDDVAVHAHEVFRFAHPAARFVFAFLGHAWNTQSTRCVLTRDCPLSRINQKDFFADPFTRLEFELRRIREFFDS
jgi:hypothetical protein